MIRRDLNINNKYPFVLCILDGWGIAPSWGGNAIASADTPNFNKLLRSWPNTTLLASGQAVGLPEGSPGNSEAGHLNIGAGRKVHQDQTVIDTQIDNGKFYDNKVLIGAFTHAKENNSNVHILGLLSKTGTHAHINHLYALLNLAKKLNFNRVYIHLFSDGRDSDPLSGIELIDEVEKKIAEIGVGWIASIGGRYYSMDRDNRWGRTARAYNYLVRGEAEKESHPRQVFAKSYSEGVSDEFIEPKLIVSRNHQTELVSDNDSIILFNFRTDRIRQLTKAFISDDLPEFQDRKKLKDLYFVSFDMYGNGYSDKVFRPFAPDGIENPLARILSNAKIKQFHIAETEKYPHVTYFINGGKETPFLGEEDLAIPSPNVKTYDLTPKMSAELVTNTLVEKIKKNEADFYLVNFANPDMVGHSGNLKATEQAVGFVDKMLAKLLNEISNQNGNIFITADHGNAEQMVNPSSGQPDTEHTTNPVPFIMAGRSIGKNRILATNGSIWNITPTILDFLEIRKPEELSSSESLIIKQN